MNKQELTQMVAEILGTIGTEPMVKASDYRPSDPGPERKSTHLPDSGFVPDVTELDLRKLYLVEDPAQKDKYSHMKLRTYHPLAVCQAGMQMFGFAGINHMCAENVFFPIET